LTLIWTALLMTYGSGTRLFVFAVEKARQMGLAHTKQLADGC
jgi:hypothetical protein